MDTSTADNQEKLVLRMRGEFSPRLTFDCGQAFRWRQIGENMYSGVAYGRALKLTQDGSRFELRGASVKRDEGIFRAYFDADRDYDALLERFSVNPYLYLAGQYARGIRLLKQEPWEALITFIVSQNNNIARIRGIIERLCREAGRRLEGAEYAFPTACEIAGMTDDCMACLKLGYRDRYLRDAAARALDGRPDIDALKYLTPGEAKKKLLEICGVGDKVADCALLYGYGFTTHSPNDVWMKRVMKAWLPNGYPAELAGAEGIAQQYLFYYARAHADELAQA